MGRRLVLGKHIVVTHGAVDRLEFFLMRKLYTIEIGVAVDTAELAMH
jgi:hypothetical protein